MNKFLAPNGKPSNLTPEQYKLVRTPAFKEWFGDWEKLILTKINDSGIDEVSLKRLEDGVSKVVDKNGEPMVVWHTTNNEFNKFDKRKSREGFFFSPQKNRLVVYNKTKINSYFLNLRNPSHEIFKLDLKYLKPKGYDGIMDYGHDKKSGNENLYEIIAFEPNQIKLADGTNTTFDSNNPDIRFDEGGSITKLEKYIKDIEVVDDEDGIMYYGKFGNNGSLTWITQGEFIIVNTIDSGNKKGGEGTMAIANLFLSNPKVKTITYQDHSHFQDGKSFWVKIGGDDIDLDRGNFFNYFENKFGYNPDIRYKKGGLIAPNGKPSNLTPEQYKLVRTPAFKKWFGDWENDPKNASKVVDSNGEPLVVYHGTANREFNEFKFNENIGGGLHKGFKAIFFTNDLDNAGWYASEVHRLSGLKGDYGRIIECFISVKNPIEEELSFFYEMAKWGSEKLNDIRANSIEDGSDGFIVKQFDEYEKEYTDYTEYVCFNSNQIKLADGTNTTFDGRNPDIRFKKGGRTISQTPAPKKDQIKGSDKNKEGSSKDLTSAKKIELSDSTIEAIKNKVDKHNEKHPKKKITIDSAKAVVRRGMGAYSSSHRPTIKGGNPNSRVAWGLARLNAFLYKIVNGKSKSGKYSQDNDLIEELGYKVEKYEIGGIFQGTPYDFNAYSTEYMGTGEGNQVFGWGLYFTDVKDIARYYMSAGLYDDEQKIMLNGKSLSKYKIQQEVKDQIVGIVDTIFGEDKMIPTINSIKGYLVLEYDEENYPELKEIVELCNKTYDFIKDKKLSFIGNIYSVTLFKGKNPDEYDLLEWENPVRVEQLIKIFEEAEKIGGIDFKDGWEVDDKYGLTNNRGYKVTGEEMYRWLSKKLFRDKEASLFLLGAGIDGIKYKAGTLSGFEDVDGYNYVIFDANDITIEGKEKYEEILAGKEKYADGGSVLLAPNGKPSNLTPEQYKLVRTKAFISWFGDWENDPTNASKVVDENGEPLVVYHATTESFSVFDTKKIDIGTNTTTDGFFFSTNKEYIKKFSNKYLECFLKIKTPIIIDEKGKSKKLNKNEIDKVISNRIKDKNVDDDFLFDSKGFLDIIYGKTKKVQTSYGQLNYVLKYIFKNDYEDYSNRLFTETKIDGFFRQDTFICLFSNQIKLADGSNTTFDGNNPDIRFDNGGEADEPTHFWGTEAGGVLVYCSTTERYLILLRSEWVLEPNTWGIISGKLDDDETNIEDAVLRESEEETGHKLGDLIPSFIFEKPNFKFHNFVSIIEKEFVPELNWENTDYKWVKLNEMPDNLHFGLKLLLQKEDMQTLVEKNKNNTMNKYNPKDEVTFNIPLLIRFAELMREEIKTDVALHEVIENLIDIKDKGTLTMRDYDSMVGNVTGSEENTNTDAVEEEKMAEGGKVNSIKSKKGDIKMSLDENWYSDDTKVELVPVSELMKFREFDRKVKPKYNQDNSRDNINHLKYMFQKDGVQEPLIIEYSAQDNAVLVIEGNHRINSAIDLGMEYLPARVVLKKYSKFSKNQLKNAMKVSGFEANEFGYIPSNMKPSKVGIQGTKPIVFGDGGIIEGRLHSECDVNEGCGRQFQVGENGHIIEAERDEAVIVADAFDDNENYTVKGTPSEIASALNVMGGGKNFDKGAEIIKNGQELEMPELEKEATDTDVADVIDSGSIIINRRSMADEKEYEVTGTPKQIASAINSINGNGVVIEKGAEIKEN